MSLYCTELEIEEKGTVVYSNGSEEKITVNMYLQHPVGWSNDCLMVNIEVLKGNKIIGEVTIPFDIYMKFAKKSQT